MSIEESDPEPKNELRRKYIEHSKKNKRNANIVKRNLS